MSGYHYKRFAKSLLILAPDFPMDAIEIEGFVRTQGLDHFIRIADAYDPGISEVTRLLIHHGEGGMPLGKG